MWFGANPFAKSQASEEKKKELKELPAGTSVNWVGRAFQFCPIHCLIERPMTSDQPMTGILFIIIIYNQIDN